MNWQRHDDNNHRCKSKVAHPDLRTGICDQLSHPSFSRTSRLCPRCSSGVLGHDFWSGIWCHTAPPCVCLTHCNDSNGGLDSVNLWSLNDLRKSMHDQHLYPSDRIYNPPTGLLWPIGDEIRWCENFQSSCRSKERPIMFECGSFGVGDTNITPPFSEVKCSIWLRSSKGRTKAL